VETWESWVERNGSWYSKGQEMDRAGFQN
jgi:hypothetical protein